MKLSVNQVDALQILREEKTIEVGSPIVNGRTMNSLYAKHLIKCPRYANGEFWEMTDKGYEFLTEYQLYLVEKFKKRHNGL